jgi:hypothetical protein
MIRLGTLLVLLDLFMRASSWSILSPSSVFRSRPSSLTYFYSSVGGGCSPRCRTHLPSVDISSKHNTPQASPTKKKKKSRTWDESYELLKRYQQTYGNCNVPTAWKEDPTLANWVKTQRKYQLTMSEVRRAALDAIGFDWDQPATAWNEMFLRLVKYKEEHGNCNVPAGRKKDPSLGNWVATQRAEKTKLTDDRRNALDSLGFQWKRQRPWDDMYQ